MNSTKLLLGGAASLEIWPSGDLSELASWARYRALQEQYRKDVRVEVKKRIEGQTGHLVITSDSRGRVIVCKSQ